MVNTNMTRSMRSGAIAAAMIGAMALPQSSMLAAAAPKIPIPQSERAMSKRQRRRLQTKEKNKSERRQQHASNRLSTISRIRSKLTERGDQRAFNDVVSAMRNYERNQWAKAGYPGLQGSDIKKLKSYAGAAMRRLSGEYIVLGQAAAQ